MRLDIIVSISLDYKFLITCKQKHNYRLHFDSNNTTETHPFLHSEIPLNCHIK